jgi:hypothetical protein
MSKHTPEPWKVVPERGGFSLLHRFPDGSFRVVAHFIESEDDANLAAGAPELYEVAKLALRICVDATMQGADIDDVTAEDLATLEGAVRAAIAKAEGKS